MFAPGSRSRQSLGVVAESRVQNMTGAVFVDDGPGEVDEDGGRGGGTIVEGVDVRRVSFGSGSGVEGRRSRVGSGNGPRDDLLR